MARSVSLFAERPWRVPGSGIGVSRTRGWPCGQDHPRVALPNRQIGWTCSACGPLAPRAGVYSTRWLSWRLR